MTNNAATTDFVPQLEKLRNDMGLSLTVFAKVLGVHYQTYIQWRSGTIKSVRQEVVSDVSSRVEIINTMRRQLSWRQNNPLVSKMNPRKRDDVFLQRFKEQWVKARKPQMVGTILI